MHNRRNFIKISSLGLGATVVAVSSLKWAMGASDKKLSGG